MDKHYIGLDLTGFEDNGIMRPISRVTLLVDDDAAITAGDDTGLEITADCPYGTQEIANALLARLKGYKYQTYTADDTNIDPAAELGDGVTVGGIYSVLSRISDDGNGYPSLSGPGEAELEDEFPTAGPMTQAFNRKIATTRSIIEKTASEIRQRVEEVSEGSAEKYAELSTKLDSITLEVSNGKTESTFTLKAGEAVLSSGTIKMTGLVTFENLSNSGQTTINGGNIITGTITADKLSVTDLSAFQATIGGFTIGSSAIYNGMTSLSSTTNGVYLGTSGIALGGGKFKVTSAGALTATNATITGTINATSGTFQSVTISGSTFSGSLSNATGSFNGSSYGNLYGDLINCGGVFGNSGKSSQLYNTGGAFGGGTTDAWLTSVSGTFTGTNSGYLTGTASSAYISSCSLNGTSLTMGNGSGSLGSSSGSSTAVLRADVVAALRCGGVALSCTQSQITTNGKLTVYGGFEVMNGIKARVIDTGAYGLRLLSAYETPMPTFSDYGVGVLDEDGICYIYIDPIFAETVQKYDLPVVFLTKYGAGDIWADKITHDLLTIRGTPGLKFAWEARYQQANVDVVRLKEKDLGETFTPDYDFEGDAAVDWEHDPIDHDYGLEGMDYLREYEIESVNYANEGYNYLYDYERSLES